MTIPGGTQRASGPHALAHDKQSHGVGGDKVMKKGGEGPHNWGGPQSELADEIAAQEDARRDAEQARAEGDEHPAGQTFAERAGTDVDADAVNRSKGTEGGFAGNPGSGEQEIIRDASTGNTA